MADIIETIVIPEVPRVLDNQELFVYVPAQYANINLINGDENFVIIQKGNNTVSSSANGGTVVLGVGNTLTADTTSEGKDIVIIGDNNIVTDSGNKVFGISIETSGKDTVYIGAYNDKTSQRSDTVLVLAAGSVDVPFTAIEAGITEQNSKFIRLGDINTTITVPIKNDKLSNGMYDVSTSFVTRSNNTTYEIVYGRNLGTETIYRLSYTALLNTLAYRDNYGQLRVHVKYNNYNDTSVSNDNNGLIVPNMGYLEDRYVPYNKTGIYNAVYIRGYNNGSYYNTVTELSDIDYTGNTIVQRTSGQIIAADATSAHAVVTKGQMEQYVPSAIAGAIAALGTVYVFKGSVATISNLPNTANPGDVYNVIENDMNYAWTGSAWDQLGGTIATEYTAGTGISIVSGAISVTNPVTSTDISNWNSKQDALSTSHGIVLSGDTLELNIVPANASIQFVNSGVDEKSISVRYSDGLKVRQHLGGIQSGDGLVVKIGKGLFFDSQDDGNITINLGSSGYLVNNSGNDTNQLDLSSAAITKLNSLKSDGIGDKFLSNNGQYLEVTDKPCHINFKGLTIGRHPDNVEESNQSPLWYQMTDDGYFVSQPSVTTQNGLNVINDNGITVLALASYDDTVNPVYNRYMNNRFEIGNVCFKSNVKIKCYMDVYLTRTISQSESFKVYPITRQGHLDEINAIELISQINGATSQTWYTITFDIINRDYIGYRFVYITGSGKRQNGINIREMVFIPQETWTEATLDYDDDIPPTSVLYAKIPKYATEITFDGAFTYSQEFNVTNSARIASGIYRLNVATIESEASTKITSVPMLVDGEMTLLQLRPYYISGVFEGYSLLYGVYTATFTSLTIRYR